MAKQASGRMRARQKDGGVAVRVLLKHPMETGARKHPGTGEPIPRHFIREVACSHNGEPIMTLEWGWGVAKDPYIAFDLLQGNAGDTVAVEWTDSLGESGRVETLVK